VQCAAALAVLDVIENEGLVGRAAEAGERVMKELERMAGSAQVRGRGLMIGVEFDRPVARDIAAAALEHGVLVNDATPSVVRLTPPLIITDDEIDEGLAILEEVFGAV
jgi:acetylornithine aminotransferase